MPSLLRDDDTLVPLEDTGGDNVWRCTSLAALLYESLGLDIPLEAPPIVKPRTYRRRSTVDFSKAFSPANQPSGTDRTSDPLWVCFMLIHCNFDLD